VTPDSGHASDAPDITITGSNFQPGVRVRIGGVVSPDVELMGPTMLSVEPPALSPGTLNDVRVTNPGGGNDLVAKAWFANFGDVPQSHLFQPAVERVFRYGVTSGCGAGNFCPDLALTRGEAAKFLLKAKHGPAYTPPPPRGIIFLDVPASAPFAAWIEQLWAEGISGGCGAGKFCPAEKLNRTSLAVLMLKAIHGGAYRPPAGVGLFSDVPISSNIYAGWIEQFYREGITSGCGTKKFCPSRLTSRGEMAVFLARGFDVP
jgi:hypothetical protein